MASVLERVRTGLADSLGRGEDVVSAIAMSTPQRQVAQTLGAGLGGALGALVVALVARGRDRRPAQTPSQFIVAMTTERLLVVDSVTLAVRREAQLGSVSLVKVSDGTAGRELRVIDSSGGFRGVAQRRTVEAFGAAVAGAAGVGLMTDAKQSFWLLRAFVVGVLFTFGVGAVLLAIPTASEDGTGSALMWAIAGLVMVGVGECLRRVLLRPVVTSPVTEIIDKAVP
jgi:hypothetical protein